MVQGVAIGTIEPVFAVTVRWFICLTHGVSSLGSGLRKGGRTGRTAVTALSVLRTLMSDLFAVAGQQNAGDRLSGPAATPIVCPIRQDVREQF